MGCHCTCISYSRARTPILIPASSSGVEHATTSSEWHSGLPVKIALTFLEGAQEVAAATDRPTSRTNCLTFPQESRGKRGARRAFLMLEIIVPELHPHEDFHKEGREQKSLILWVMTNKSNSTAQTLNSDKLPKEKESCVPTTTQSRSRPLDSSEV